MNMQLSDPWWKRELDKERQKKGVPTRDVPAKDETDGIPLHDSVVVDDDPEDDTVITPDRVIIIPNDDEDPSVVIDEDEEVPSVVDVHKFDARIHETLR